MLELALVTPLLLALVVGVIELGRYSYIGILVGNAARAGADYGAQSLAQSVDTSGIQTAAQNDYQSNGQRICNPNGKPPVTTSCLTVTSSVSCACDNNGTLTPNPPTTGYCNPSPTGTNASAGTCAAGHWVVMVSVTGSGTFNSIFRYPGIPTSISVSRTSTMRVAQQ